MWKQLVPSQHGQHDGHHYNHSNANEERLVEGHVTDQSRAFVQRFNSHDRDTKTFHRNTDVGRQGSVERRGPPRQSWRGSQTDNRALLVSRFAGPSRGWGRVRWPMPSGAILWRFLAGRGTVFQKPIRRSGAVPRSDSVGAAPRTASPTFKS